MKKYYLLCMSAFLAIVMSGCFGTGGGGGGGGITFTDGEGDRIAIDVEILDEYETYHGFWKILPWRGKAELYLKVHNSKDPKVSLLYPLNVGSNVSGTRQVKLITPWRYDNDLKVLTLEVLDDDKIGKKEEKLLTDAATTAAMIAWDTAGAKAYKVDKELANTIFKNNAKISDLAKDSVMVLVDNLNQHQFDSQGIYEYKVFKKEGTIVNNPFVILHSNNSSHALCRVKIYALEDDKK